MQSRQKYLLIGLAAAVLFWMGGGWVRQTVLGPIAKLRDDLNKAQNRVSDKIDQELQIARAKKKLLDWQAQSLPPDSGKKRIPDAAEAQRQYLEWLTGLADDIGFEEVHVTPQQSRPMVLTQRNASMASGNAVVCMEVVVQIDGLGRLSQLYDLLDRIGSVNLLQRTSQLKITTEDVLGDPPVKFILHSAGLAMTDAPPRRTLFPRTELAEKVDSEATRWTVSESAGFPKQAPFRVRLDREYVEVTEMQDRIWTVKRGVNRSEPGEHAAGCTVTLAPVNSEHGPLTAEAFAELVRENPFVKPTPPRQYDMRFGPFSSAVVVQGKTFELSLTASEFDPARGEPSYRAVGKTPAGLSVNPKSGKLTWKPDAKLRVGEYPVKVQVRHPSAPDGSISQPLKLTLVEPNSPPKISPVASQSLYRGLVWRFKMNATDPDKPEQRLSFKLGSNAPAGCQINASTGEITWTPAESQPVGRATIPVTVSDSGQPPQTATANVTVDVQEDTAKQTLLTGIVVINGQPEARFSNTKLNQATVLKIGDELSAADITATITDIAARMVTVRLGEVERPLKLGESVRSLTSGPDVKPAPTDDSKPAAHRFR